MTRRNYFLDKAFESYVLVKISVFKFSGTFSVWNQLSVPNFMRIW